MILKTNAKETRICKSTKKQNRPNGITNIVQDLKVFPTQRKVIYILQGKTTVMTVGSPKLNRQKLRRGRFYHPNVES